MRAAERARNALLDAAETVVRRVGAGTLTLDAVAARAGVNRGGLLHHFPRKDHLLESLVHRTVTLWRAEVLNAIENTPPGPGRAGRALLQLCLEDQTCRDENMRRTSLSLVAALVNREGLVGPLREFRVELLALAEHDGAPLAANEVVLLAVHGLWYEWMCGLSDLTPERADRLNRTLSKVIRPTRRTRPPIAANARKKSK